jgi:hypothetical protein
VGAYTLHIVVTRKIFKKVAGTMFPNKIVEISASPLRKPQLIRRGEQKNQRDFFAAVAAPGSLAAKRFGVPRSRGPDRLKPELRTNFRRSLSSFFLCAPLRSWCALR